MRRDTDAAREEVILEARAGFKNTHWGRARNRRIVCAYLSCPRRSKGLGRAEKRRRRKLDFWASGERDINADVGIRCLLWACCVFEVSRASQSARNAKYSRGALWCTEVAMRKGRRRDLPRVVSTRRIVYSGRLAHGATRFQSGNATHMSDMNSAIAAVVRIPPPNQRYSRVRTSAESRSGQTRTPPAGCIARRVAFCGWRRRAHCWRGRTANGAETRGRRFGELDAGVQVTRAAGGQRGASRCRSGHGGRRERRPE